MFSVGIALFPQSCLLTCFVLFTFRRTFFIFNSIINDEGNNDTQMRFSRHIKKNKTTEMLTYLHGLVKIVGLHKTPFSFVSVIFVDMLIDTHSTHVT